MNRTPMAPDSMHSISIRGQKKKKNITESLYLVVGISVKTLKNIWK